MSVKSYIWCLYSKLPNRSAQSHRSNYIRKTLLPCIVYGTTYTGPPYTASWSITNFFFLFLFSGSVHPFYERCGLSETSAGGCFSGVVISQSVETCKRNVCYFCVVLNMITQLNSVNKHRSQQGFRCTNVRKMAADFGSNEGVVSFRSIASLKN